MLTVKKGMPTGADHRIHTTFGHDPSTLRLCSKSPNLQNIPRGGTEAQRWVKDIFEAGPGCVFLEADYSALEAVLVGYFANSARYMRFAKLGVHAYMAAQMPEVGWTIDLSRPDAEIKDLFKTLKRDHDGPYNTAKRVVHLSNYLGTPRRMWEEYPETFPTIEAARELQEFYFHLFPEIREWHKHLCETVDATRRKKAEEGEDPTPWSLGVATVQNPFGYLHRFYHVLEWEKIEGTWYPSYGEDAKRLIAFLPQSTGAGIIKRAASSLYYDFPDLRRHLRLLIHDSILMEVPEDEVRDIATIVKETMTQPIPELPLDPSWNMGDHVTIGVEIKVGKIWSEMKEIAV